MATISNHNQTEAMRKSIWIALAICALVSIAIFWWVQSGSAFLGFKSGLILTTRIRILLLLATACFLQSALYAILWRMRVAELWVNNTLDLLSAPRLQYRFQAHFWFFLAGLACLGVLVVSASLTEQKSSSGDES
jgi:hypothetical protein